MRYNVYGLNAISKEPLPPLSVDADNAEAARQRAAQEGMLVQSVEPAEGLPAKATTKRSAPPQSNRRDGLGILSVVFGGVVFGIVLLAIAVKLFRTNLGL